MSTAGEAITEVIDGYFKDKRDNRVKGQANFGSYESDDLTCVHLDGDINLAELGEYIATRLGMVTRIETAQVEKEEEALAQAEEIIAASKVVEE